MRLNLPGAGGDDAGAILITIRINDPGGEDEINKELLNLGQVKKQHVV